MTFLLILSPRMHESFYLFIYLFKTRRQQSQIKLHNISITDLFILSVALNVIKYEEKKKELHKRESKSGGHAIYKFLRNFNIPFLKNLRYDIYTPIG